MTPEEQVKEVIRRFEAETLLRMEKQAQEGKEEIQSFVATYIANLSIELPMSVKAILDKGGAVRQVISEVSAPWGDGLIDFTYSAHSSRLHIPELERVKKVRITVLVEPLEWFK